MNLNQMTAHVLRPTARACVIVGLSVPAGADTFEWTNTVNGLYTTAGNWTNTTGIDPAPPNAGDTALFNEVGTYTVTLSASPVASDLLQVTAGNVTFRENLIGGGIYNLTTGAADAQITSGAALNLGLINDPATLNVGDDLSVQSGGTININFGSDATTNDLILGTSGSGLTSSITVDGVGSTLTRTSTGTSVVMGQNGATGNLTFRNGATGDINGSMIVVSSGNALSSANVMVESDADLELDSLVVGASASSAAPVGTVTVTGIGSTITQTGASTLTLGLASGNSGVLNVNASGVYTTGTGLTTVNATGDINIDGGTMNFGGDVLINGGTYAENQAGTATRTFADNTTLTVQNGGGMTLNASSFLIDRGRTFVLDGSTSALNLEGSFTGLTIGGTSDPTAATVTLRNNANLTVDAVTMRAGTTGQTSVLNIESGAGLYIQGSSFFTISGSDINTGASVINITDPGSALVILDAAGLVRLGRYAGSTTDMNIIGEGYFESDDEGLEVLPTGTVSLDDGLLFLRGDLVVRGGQINTATGYGRVSLDPFTQTQVRVAEGGTVALRQDIFELAANHLLVEGPGSSFTFDASTPLDGQVWLVNAGGGVSSSVIVRDQAVLDIGSLSTAGSAISTTGLNTIDISTGGTATVNHLGVGVLVYDDGAGYFDTSTYEPGQLTIDGPGSRLSIRAGFQAHIGHASEFADLANVHGTVNLTDGGTLDTTAGTLYLNRAGILNLDGGTLDAGAIVHDYRSEVNFNSGTISFTGGLTLDNGQLLGPTLDLATGKHLIMTGSTSVSAIGSLAINGGSLTTTNILLAPGAAFAFNAGALTLDALDVTTGELLGAYVALPAGKSLTTLGDMTVAADGQIDLTGGTIAADNLQVSGQLIYNGGTLDVGGVIDVFSGAQFVVAAGRQLNLSTDLDNAGRLDLLGAGARVQGASLLGNTGLVSGDGTIAAPFTNHAAGEVRVHSGDTLTISGAMGANQGKLNLQGGLMEITQPMTNAATGDILGRGTLVTEGLTNLGDMAFSAGVTDVLGDVNNQTTGRVIISGNADVIFWDDVAHTGALFNVSTGSSATFFGTAGFGVSGGGDVYFEADVTPGSSPGLETFGGNVFFGALATLVIELSGATPGSEHDKLDVIGQLALGGTLDLVLIDAPGGGLFSPGAGDTFDILDWGSIVGTFNDVQLPALGAGLSWDTSQLYTSGVLSVLGALLEGDLNGDGFVGIADLNIVLGNWNQNVTGGSLLDGDPSGDGFVGIADLNVVLGNWNAGTPPGDANAIVPEPTTLALLFGLLHVCLTRRSAATTPAA